MEGIKAISKKVRQKEQNQEKRNEGAEKNRKR